jgi:TPP-dependent pyruvate/acetoin dehydrogenase alpha subunit
MVTLRLVSARMVDLQRSDAIAFHAACLGEEAVIAAAASAARPHDWVFPGLREWGATIVRGLPIATYVHHAFGTGRDPAKGHAAPDHPPARGFKVAPASGVAGAHVLQAVGAAWAAKIKKDDVAAIAIFGDAANASGDLHNALNFAGVFKAPCVFVCRHDGRGPSLQGERAVAYGLASARVDGSDALAVLAVVRSALARAAAGKGATLIEATTKPLVPAITDDGLRRGDAALLALGDDDPIVRLRAVLVRERILDSAGQDLVAAGVRAALDAAVAETAATPRPARSTIFDDVYAEVPAHLEAQKAEKESSTWPR